MAITEGSSNQTKFFSSGAISFRALQTTFGGNANAVKFSTYRRNTDQDETNPIVPDATENAAVSSTLSNLEASDFRNTIKEYIITQSGSANSDLDIDNLDWNSNLNKNVIKKFNVNSTIAASAANTDAATFDQEAYNLTFDVTGSILGVGGAGGSANCGNGSAGGDALYVNNTSNRSGASAKITVSVNSNGKIWAGGGGGGAGNTGNSGNSINCYFNSSNSVNVYSGGSTNSSRGCNQGNCPNTRTVNGVTGNLQNSSCYQSGGSRKRCRKRQDRGQACSESWSKNCNYKHTYSLGAGSGGNGGNGGVGQGQNNNSPGGGNSGNSGNTVTCNITGNSSTGNTGNSGASGGNWGQPGGNACGNGGAAGRAIYKGNGNVYNVNGASTNNIKGSY